MNDKKLIREVSQHRFLFDRNVEDYRDGQKKELQWQKIGCALNIPADLAYRRWRDLRDRYVKERKKETQSLQSPDGILYKSRWHLMGYLDFLQDTIKHRDNFNACFFGREYESVAEQEQQGEINTTENMVRLSRRSLEGKKDELNDAEERLYPVPPPFTRGSSSERGHKYRKSKGIKGMHHSVLSTQDKPFPSTWFFIPSTTSDMRVPDLADRMGMDDQSSPNKLEGSSNYLTCSPLISAMSGMHEDLMSTAGPSSSSQDTGESEAMQGDYDQDDVDVKAEPVFNVEPDICEDESQNNTQSSCDRRSSQSSPAPGMAGPYLLKKETHCTTILDQLLRDDTFCDVTLTAEGQSMRAHKIVLCLASAYFRQVLSKESNVQNVIVFRDIKFTELKNLINFIYTGEATVDAAELESFMKTAEMLEVTSLCDGQRKLPKNLIPKSKETEAEKVKPTLSAKRSHNTCVTPPPVKSRKIEDASISKSPKSASYASTSGGTPFPPHLIFHSAPVIKTEPSVEEDNVEEEYHSFESVRHSPAYHPDSDPPLSVDRTNDPGPSLEKVPVGRLSAPKMKRQQLLSDYLRKKTRSEISNEDSSEHEHQTPKADEISTSKTAQIREEDSAAASQLEVHEDPGEHLSDLTPRYGEISTLNAREEDREAALPDCWNMKQVEEFQKNMMG